MKVLTIIALLFLASCSSKKTQENEDQMYCSKMPSYTKEERVNKAYCEMGAHLRSKRFNKE